MMRWLWAGLFAATLLSFAYLFHREETFIRAQVVSAWSEDHRADCAVVVTGGPGRVREGFDLLAQGQVHKLIISGVHPRATLRDIFPQWPFYGGLREDDVVLERRSTTTYGNALQSLPLVKAVRCRSVVLVTSQLHMHRAFKTFRQVFPADVVLLTRSVSSGAVPPRSGDLTVEVLKSLFYSLWAY